MWQDDLVTIVRSLISDLDSQRYTDARLQKLIVVAAYEVYSVAEFVTYTFSITNSTISPDPIATGDNVFSVLIAYKAACIILANELKMTSNVAMKDGPSFVDTKGAGTNIANVQKQICAKYEELLADYQLGGSDAFQSGGPGQAILGPYSPGADLFNWNTNPHRDNGWR